MADENEVIEQIKVSELPEATSLENLYTLGTKITGSGKESVRVPLTALSSPPYIGSDGYWYVFSKAAGGYVRTDNIATAYQAAVAGGYTGTEAQFLADLGAVGSIKVVYLTEAEYQARRTAGTLDSSTYYATPEE